MTRRAFGNCTDTVVAYLREHGRLTEAQLVRLTGQTQRQVAVTLSRLAHDGPRLGKRAYRAAWVSGDPLMKKPHLSPVWALGSMPCAPRPPAITPSTPRKLRKIMLAQRHRYTASEAMRNAAS